MPNLLSSGAEGWSRVESIGERVNLAGMALLQTGERWVLLARDEEVVVNGSLLVTGLHVLRHADEFSCGGARHIFEEGGGVYPGPFPGSEAIRCTRCHTPINPGAPAVRCACGLYYHQDETGGLTCFAYGDGARCTRCQRPTLMGEGERIDPEA